MHYLDTKPTTLLYNHSYNHTHTYIHKYTNHKQTRPHTHKHEGRPPYLPGKVLVGWLKDPLPEEGPEPDPGGDRGPRPHTALLELELGRGRDEMVGEAALLEAAPEAEAVLVAGAAFRPGAAVLACNRKASIIMLH